MLHQRLASTAQVTTESLPFFLETGQSIIAQLALNSALLDSTPDELTETLRQYLRTIPFYNQVYVLDAQGKSKAGYPEKDYNRNPAPVDEQAGIKRA